MKHPLRLVLIGTALPLAACMTTGTNMHGDFACRAPNGTCAPMSVIDAKAVAGLGGSVQPAGGIGEASVPREGRVVTASADDSPPGRTSDRVLRVVFPAHIDASGIYHDESTAHAVVEHGGWTDGLTGGARRTPVDPRTADIMQSGKSADLQTGKSGGLQESKLASLDDIIAGTAGARKMEGEGGTATVAITPASAAGASTAVRLAMMRSPVAIDLREAAAAASAQPVAGLDPNFDTSDVNAAADSEVTALPSHCTGNRPVWWHGHAYRRPRSVPCPTKVTAASHGASPTAATALSTTRSLNLAHLNHDAARPPVTTGRPTTTLSVTPLSSSAPSQPVLSGAAAVRPPAASAGARYTPTTDPAVASARVSSMASPVIAGQARLGRAAAEPASPVPSNQLFAGTGITAPGASGESPR